MNKKNIKIAIYVLVVLAIGAILFIFLKIRGTPKQVSEKFQQNINIVNYFEGTSFPVENNIKKSDFNFPTDLPYLKQTSYGGIVTSTINKIASNFGFNNDPQAFEDVQKGRVLIWNGDVYSLNIIPQKNFVQLVSNASTRILVQNVEDKKLKDEDLKAISSELITSKIGLDPNNIKFTGFSYFKIQDGVENLIKTNKDGAQIIQLNYSEGNFKYPVLTENPDLSQISIQILKNGYVINFSANIGIGFEESSSKYPLKNYDQFVSEIGKSILVSLEDNNINLPDIKSSDIKNVTAKKVSLVYLLDFSKQKISQPVFLIEGTAVVNGFTSPLSALFYLPAFEGFTDSKP